MTSTGTLTLTDFLLARIAEDEARAEWVVMLPTVSEFEQGTFRAAFTDLGEHGWFNPDRVFHESRAKRRIVDLAAQYVKPEDTFDSGFIGGANHVGYNALRYLAEPYCDHPDYRAEWSV